ncbi:bifunctional chorismate mutase/prephenate dehydrogenase [compost metagenome]
MVGKRFQAIQEACKIKKEYGVPVVQQSRMNQMISGKKDTTRLANIPDSFVNDLYAVLTRHSMELERQATH